MPPGRRKEYELLDEVVLQVKLLDVLFIRHYLLSRLGSRIRIPLKAWMFILVFLCCAVLCR
jgi:phage gp36-like protein